jgi:hypothetical protein
MTLSIDIQHNSKECHYAECRYAESRDYLNVMVSVVMLSVVVLSVVRLNVIRLSVVVPFTPRANVIKLFTERICKKTKWARVFVPDKL